MSGGASAGPRSSNAIVIGAASQVGAFLVPSLLAAGVSVAAMSRRPQHDTRAGIRWFAGDLRESVDWPALQGPSALFHLAHLTLLPDHIEALAARGVCRIVAFSSTGRFGKARSGSATEREAADRLARAEDRYIRGCERAAIPWTLFRPTMIYGLDLDRNVSFIARTVKRWRFFALAGRGSGLRQPVHAEDLAAACMAVLNSTKSHGKTYTLSGGEVLSYRELVERVFAGLNLKPRFVVVPVVVLRALIQVIRLVPRFRHLNPEMANRMNVDACFDHSEAILDFDFHPRERFAYSAGEHAALRDMRG